MRYLISRCKPQDRLFCRFLSGFLHGIEPLQEAVLHALGLVAGHGVQRHGMDAAEDTVFDVGIGPLQAAQQGLDLLPLGTAAAVVAHGAVFGETAGTLDEFQFVVALPGQNVLFVDAVHRADEGHAGKAGAVQFGRHGLQLGTVEHTHNGGLDHVVEVMSQRNFVAAQLLGLAVQVSPAHPGAEVTGVLVGVVGDRKNIALKNGHRDVQQLRVGFDLLAVDLVVAGIHDQKHQFKRNIAVALQFLQELGHQHGVFAAGDAHGDAVAGLHQFIALDRHDEGRPQFLAVLFDDAAFDQLIGFQSLFHGIPRFSGLSQGMITGIERLQEFAQFGLGGKVAQADAPGGQRVAAVAADREHRPGGQTVR